MLTLFKTNSVKVCCSPSAQEQPSRSVSPFILMACKLFMILVTFPPLHSR